jgi:hypothetical protein
MTNCAMNCEKLIVRNQRLLIKYPDSFRCYKGPVSLKTDMVMQSFDSMNEMMRQMLK